MARYVFGDELKPGERWKRRLLEAPTEHTAFGGRIPNPSRREPSDRSRSSLTVCGARMR